MTADDERDRNQDTSYREAWDNDVLADIAAATPRPNPVRRCDDCGRFCQVLYDIWLTPPSSGIDRQVCQYCVGSA